MVVKNKTKVGFGSGCDRSTFTMHPKLDTTGAYHETSVGRDPARYHPKEIDEIYKVNKNSTKEPWTSKKELEIWSKNLGFRNVKILTKRKFESSLRGPAWHDVKEVPKYEPACNNLGFGRTPRFKTLQSLTPGPATYYRPHPYKAPYGPHSTRPTFEREHPCRFKDYTPSWKPAPGRYTVIDHESIEMKPKKLVSIRGPYDLFTGKRDASTIISRTKTHKKASAATWPIKLPGCLETYKKSHLGEFNKTGMETPYRGRNAVIDLSMRIHQKGEPGPGSYETAPVKKFEQYKHGFNSSYVKPRNYQRVVVWPAVGRYNIVPKSQACCDRIFGKGHRHVFLSKEPRTIGDYLPQPMNNF